MTRSTRNILIFAFATAAAGFIGAGINRLVPQPSDDPFQTLGALVLLALPLLTAVLLRWLGGDGWGDFGLRPHLRTAWPWYLAALLIVPLITLVIVLLGAALGVTTLAGLGALGWAGFFALLGTTFAGSMVKNIFEEFAWRGYLTSRLAAMGASAWVNHVVTGLVWASWHVPYYLFFLDREVLSAHTPMALAPFILFVFLVQPFHAFAYGELRLLSKSTWPAWLLHTMANAMSFALVEGGYTLLPRNGLGVVFSPGTEGVLTAALMGAIGFALYRYRMSRPAA